MTRPAAIPALLALSALCAVAPALAQAPAAPAGNYGGGVLVAPPQATYGPGSMTIALRVTGARVRINAVMKSTCAKVSFTATTSLAADGSFSARGTRRVAITRGRQVRRTFEIAGTFNGAAASGTASIRDRVTRRGAGRGTSCSNGPLAWDARRPSGEVGGRELAGGARMYGTTSQRFEGPRRPIVLRLSADATKLTRALYEVDLRCSGRTVRGVVDAPHQSMPIVAGDTVSDAERYTFRTRTTIERSVETFTARLGATGARGSLSVTSRFADRRTGRTFMTCRSGLVKWTAST